MSSANSENSASRAAAEKKMNEKIEAELVRMGNSVGEASLEWSLNYLTRNCDFLNEMSMSPLSIYAVHVWTGSQSCEFASRLSLQGNIRNMLFKLLIHPVHELVNCLKTNTYYAAALNSGKPFNFDSSISSHRLEIPLISGAYFDGDFVLNQMKWIHRLIRRTEGETINYSNEPSENKGGFSPEITFSDDLISFSMSFCSKVIFHWLTHHILMNFLYNPNGPISLLSFNILTEKLSPFFSSFDEASKGMYSDIVEFSDSIRGIWRSIKEKNTHNLSVVNCLESFTSDSEAFMKCLTEVVFKYPPDELLQNLSEFIISVNDALPHALMHGNISATPGRSPQSGSGGLHAGDSEQKRIPPDVDPREPFNSVFEAAEFERAITVCREFPDLLRPKASYSKKLVHTTQLILNYCLKENLADAKYIKEEGERPETGDGEENKSGLSANACRVRGAETGAEDRECHGTRFGAEDGVKKEAGSAEKADTEGEEANRNIEAGAGVRAGGRRREGKKSSERDGDEKAAINQHFTRGIRKGTERSGLKRRGNFEEDDPKEQGHHLYSNNKGRSGRKISLRGISDSSGSGEDSTPHPRVPEKKRACEHSVAKGSVHSSPGRRAPAAPAAAVSRSYRRWNEEETNLLINGVNRFGLGKWRIILSTAKLVNRDEVGLKDRWRNLIKGGHVTWDSKTRKYVSVKQ
ncbi:Myb family DNA-binding domain containing protein [Cryptosporidium felis]|nr:Myb family DNA-binding domain containing protein [Cryptosporidium felis]